MGKRICLAKSRSSLKKLFEKIITLQIDYERVQNIKSFKWVTLYYIACWFSSLETRVICQGLPSNFWPIMNHLIYFKKTLKYILSSSQVTYNNKQKMQLQPNYLTQSSLISFLVVVARRLTSMAQLPGLRATVIFWSAKSVCPGARDEFDQVLRVQWISSWVLS